MAKSLNNQWIKILRGIFITTLMLATSFSAFALGPDKVTTFKDSNGWKLQVNGKDFYVKGVVWGYSPKNENYSYNLWGKPEDFIKKVIDKEFSMMKSMNVNAIRAFSTIPTKWVTYIYQQYGIMTAINPLMGRYGATVGGVWRPVTDYSDSLTRETLKAEVLDTVRKYKDTPGVLMIALGNESNYGLTWSSSFEIENLPEGEKQAEKAKHLYSLYSEIISEAKKIDSNHLYTIVNGDIQYLDLIVKYNSNDLDLLGTNVYRGISFGGLWKDVKASLGKPILLMEFGSDAFNARDFAEDEAAQASYLKGQWQEMYNKSYGMGEEGNSIGGFVFEWRDEWWKFKQTENLDIQDRNASWANGGYPFDYVEGQNNMNEEWFGINRLGDMDADGVYISEPRMACDVLAEIWSIDPYSAKKSEINSEIRDLDMDLIALKSDIRMLKNAKQKSDAFAMTGGSFRAEYLFKGLDNEINEDGENGLRFDNGEMLFLDFAFQPSKNLYGDFTINILANVAQSDFEFRYGDRGLPTTFQATTTNEGGFTVTADEEFEGRERVEIYDFQATYEADSYDLVSFYHVPRYHWGYEGDFFGLMRETTDLTGENGQDIWNAKAPYGVEYVGKQSMEGLKIVLGPEVYWGANPKTILKYQFAVGSVDYAFMHADDIARRDSSSSATEATSRQSSQTALYAKTDLSKGVTMELGGIVSSTERIDDVYDRVENGNIVLDQIDAKDTLGFKAIVTFDVFDASRAYLAVNYAGLVADAGNPLTEFGTELPYSSLGNKKEVDTGILINLDPFTIYPRLLYRENLVDANPFIAPGVSGTTLSPGIDPRNRDDDPFAVLDNREARAAEIYLTYDPTPATSFYAWDNDMREDAEFAFNLGLTVTEYTTATDSELFFFEEGGTNASFGQGLPKENVWLLKSKLVFNPSTDLKIISKLEGGRQQPTGTPVGGSTEYASVEGKIIMDSKHIISAYIKKDDWGPYDFERQFNLVYPYQYKLDYSMLLDQLRSEEKSSKFGIKALYRTLDARSDNAYYQDGKNDYMFEIQAYIRLNF